MLNATTTPMSLPIPVFVKDTSWQKPLRMTRRPLLSRPWTEDQNVSWFAHRGCWHVTSASLLRKTVGKTFKGVGETEDAVICNLCVFIFSSCSKAPTLPISTGMHRRWKENRNQKVNIFPKTKQELMKNEHFSNYNKIVRAKKRNEKARTT